MARSSVGVAHVDRAVPCGDPRYHVELEWARAVVPESEAILGSEAMVAPEPPEWNLDAPGPMEKYGLASRRTL